MITIKNKLKNTDENIKVCVDVNGNLYFEYNNTMYQLNVDKNDEPYFEQNNFNVIEIEDIKPSVNKLVKSNKFISNEYIVEDNGYDFDSNNYYEYCFDDEEVIPFIFYDNNSSIIVEHRKGGEYNALYDTFIYKTINDNAPELIFRTQSSDNLSIYRVVLYTGGKFCFRAIGNMIEHKYELSINKSDAGDSLNIVKI